MAKLKSAVIYRGPSMLDGKPIIVIASGLGAASKNSKTGNLVQTWILAANIEPHKAIHTGEDSSVCGSCKHRGYIDDTGKNKERSCYVIEHQAPLSVYRAEQRGNIPEIKPSTLDLTGRIVRLGSYGDPAAVPVTVWNELISTAAGHTGYTHQWRGLQGLGMYGALLMASVDNLLEQKEAVANGWRTFRVRTSLETSAVREVTCPASKEAGQKLTCETCKACNGNYTNRKGNISIFAHGNSARASNAKLHTGA